MPLVVTAADAAVAVGTEPIASSPPCASGIRPGCALALVAFAARAAALEAKLCVVLGE